MTRSSAGLTDARCGKSLLRMVAIALLLVLIPVGYPLAFAQTFETDVTVPSEGCVLMGVPGSYVADTTDALKLVNKLRKEACKEGVPDPRDSSRSLTTSDYVPIKWSSSLEYIARIRAAEASVNVSHTRTNGTSCFSLMAPDGISSSSEVLAWGANTISGGIGMWYTEKEAWVNGDVGMTGHYTSMINPNNTYMGMACFCNPNSMYYGCQSGEFSTESALDETMGTAVENCVQKIEVQTSALSNPLIDGASQVKTGKSSRYSVWYAASFDEGGAYVYDVSVSSWQSSNPQVATVDGQGKLTAVGAGKTTVTATTSLGETVSKTVTVPKLAQSIKVSTAKKSVSYKKVRKKAVWTSKIVVKKAKGTVTYKKVSGSKFLTVNKKSGKIKVKKGTSKGTYTIRVKVTSGATSTYKAAKKTVKIKVKVR